MYIKSSKDSMTVFEIPTWMPKVQQLKCELFNILGQIFFCNL